MEAQGSLPTGPFGWALLLMVSPTTGFSPTSPSLPRGARRFTGMARKTWPKTKARFLPIAIRPHPHRDSDECAAAFPFRIANHTFRLAAHPQLPTEF